jgi:hypothetical protein
MIDNALKYNLGLCFRRKDAKGVNARELCFSGRHQNDATERTAEFGSLIGPQMPLPDLKPRQTRCSVQRIRFGGGPNLQ